MDFKSSFISFAKIDHSDIKLTTIPLKDKSNSFKVKFSLFGTGH